MLWSVDRRRDLLLIDVAHRFLGDLEPGSCTRCQVTSTVAITETGYENLSAGLPRTVAEIEALMKTEGILQILKPTTRARQD